MPLARLLRAFATLGAVTLVTQAIGFVALVVAARRLGPEYLGAATFALSTALYFAIPANFGLSLFGMLDAGREPERAREVLGEVLLARSVLGLCTFAALILLGGVLAHDQAVRSLLPLAATFILVDLVSGEWILFAVHRLGFISVARLVGQGCYAILLVLYLGTGLEGARFFVGLSILSVGLTSLISLATAVKLVGRPAWRPYPRLLWRRLLSSAPLGIATTMFQIYLVLGPVMLGYLIGSRAVGEYTIAQKIPLALIGLLDLWAASLYAQIARMIDTQRSELLAHLGTLTTLATALALPLAAGATVLGSDFIAALFGETYRPAGPTFVLLVWAFAIALAAVNVATVLAAGGDERRYAVGLTLAPVIVFPSNLLLVPVLGTEGAAVAMVAAEIVMVTFMVLRCRKVFGLPTISRERVGRVMVATIVMLLVLLVIPSEVDVLLRLTIGVVAYGSAALLVRAVRVEEVLMVMPALPSRRS